MPPFHSRSTGAFRIALIRSFGDSALTLSSRPSTSRTCGVISIDFRLRGYTPPPLLISLAS
ncbi:hypothetical protein D3C71_1346040 [compost metagenome]